VIDLGLEMGVTNVDSTDVNQIPWPEVEHPRNQASFPTK
jgi:hypothetical protein